eukprot:CAMPEP_0197488574 /NCGR_PEP_ID=MMETSP1311-20131121/3513_1 /TAXON_ID=464262 /ORGANISM="Genus nov. species nov., Strain RCC856" /LENGTH=83 /DNA_ID=CAMNT_0043032661 /DNA_START=172 /DNA_END=420 /DNA_ORIENTATION=-
MHAHSQQHSSSSAQAVLLEERHELVDRSKGLLGQLFRDQRAAVENLDEVGLCLVELEVHLQGLVAVDRVHARKEQDARLEIFQ